MVVTSGTLVLSSGRVGTERDTPDPAAPAAGRAGGERAALAGVDCGVRASVVRLAPSVHDAVRRGFVGALIDAAEQGVPLRAVADFIGDRLGLSVRPVPDAEAPGYFGWLATIAGTDGPASSAYTQQLLSWTPSHPGLLDDLASGDFFKPKA